MAGPPSRSSRTDYGLKILTTRDLGNGKTHVRVTNQIFPHAISIPLSQEMMLTQWHAPVDDENCYWYTVFTSFGKPVDKAQMRAQRLEVYELPDYRSKKNRSNDYGFDPHEQEHKTYTGMGEDINVHDQWAVESQGRIQDRTREHLGTSDKAISAYRRLLKKSIDAGEEGRAVRSWPSAPQRRRACAVPSPSTASRQSDKAEGRPIAHRPPIGASARETDARESAAESGRAGSWKA